MSLDNVIARRGGGEGQPHAADPRPADQHPAGDLRQHAAHEGHGALADHHHDRRRAARLGRRRNGRTDPAIKDWVDANARWLHYGAPIVGAVARRRDRQVARVALGREGGRRGPIVDLAVDRRSARGEAAAAAHAARPARRPTTRGRRCAASRASSSRAARDARAGRRRSAQRADARSAATSARSSRRRRSRTCTTSEGIEGRRSRRAGLLERAGVPCVVHIGVGDLAHVIIHYAKKLRRAPDLPDRHGAQRRIGAQRGHRRAQSERRGPGQRGCVTRLASRYVTARPSRHREHHGSQPEAARFAPHRVRISASIEEHA